MRIVITGAAGRLGGSLADNLGGTHDVTGLDRAALDITDFAAVTKQIGDLRPDVVIHPAAWTDVDGCARNPERAIRINGAGAQHIALAAAQVGAAVVQISTNEVFDGAQTAPCYEYDSTHPANPYGASKLYGERAVMATNPRHYIVRSSWLFAHGGRNFIQAILGAADAGKPLRVVVNEVASPTYNDDLAGAIARLIETGRYGIYHLTNSGVCSRYAFARYVLDRTGRAEVPIQPISSHEWPRPSSPPQYTHLANIAGAMAGITLRPWQEAVDAFLAREELLA
jgi:dTDP-4-dehydrorhamnose reductase